MRERICPHALATTLQTLAVVLEPPATGAGGKIGIAELDGDLVERDPEPVRRNAAETLVQSGVSPRAIDAGRAAAAW